MAGRSCVQKSGGEQPSRAASQKNIRVFWSGWFFLERGGGGEARNAACHQREGGNRGARVRSTFFSGQNGFVGWLRRGRGRRAPGRDRQSVACSRTSFFFCRVVFGRRRARPNKDRWARMCVCVRVCARDARPLLAERDGRALCTERANTPKRHFFFAIPSERSPRPCVLCCSFFSCCLWDLRVLLLHQLLARSHVFVCGRACGRGA